MMTLKQLQVARAIAHSPRSRLAEVLGAAGVLVEPEQAAPMADAHVSFSSERPVVKVVVGPGLVPGQDVAWLEAALAGRASLVERLVTTIATRLHAHRAGEPPRLSSFALAGPLDLHPSVARAIATSWIIATPTGLIPLSALVTTSETLRGHVERVASLQDARGMVVRTPEEGRVALVVEDEHPTMAKGEAIEVHEDELGLTSCDEAMLLALGPIDAVYGWSR